MISFALLFNGLLLGAAVIAAWQGQRSVFLILFYLTVVSLVSTLIGGADALTTIAIVTGCFVTATALAYVFREFLVIVLPGEASRALQGAPLTASFGLMMVVVYLAAALFAPWIAPYGESEVVAGAYAPPDENMLLGGDQLGRDMFSRIVYGARNTVGLSIATTVLAFLAGSTLGLFAAVKGGWIDQLLGRIVDTVMAIPSLIFALLLLSIFGTSTPSLILVIAFIYTPLIFRLARSVAGNIVVMDYIEAARLRGESSWHLMVDEILPNALAPLIAEFGLRFCFVFLLVAALSFLGLGIQPPTADWGSMVRENATLISFGEYTPLIPAAAIALLTVSVNFVVDWLLYRSSGLKT